MSPEQRGAAAALTRLRREVEHDRVVLDRHLTEAETLLNTAAPLSTPGDKARAAIALHAWYTGLETVLERILRELDREVPSGNASHRDIVFQATAELPQVRPAILPAALTDELLELLAFRHFFQHAYAAELDAGRLHVHLTRLLRICDEVDAAFIGFDTFIADALAATTRG